MRLGQLSRKLAIKPAEIVNFIREQYQIELDGDLNTRIEDEHADALSQKFGNSEPEIKTELSEKPEPVIASQPEITAEEENVEVTLEEPASEVPSIGDQPTENEPLESNPDAFIPLPVDPNAELIKAPKIKLDGLKVVGKIDLPEPKVKEEKAPEELESGKKKELGEEEEEYSIYKDKKGIYHFSQTQRENRKNSLERIKRDKQEAVRKQSKARHYEKLVDTEKKPVDQVRKMKKSTKREKELERQKPKRQGIWGKFLNWLND